ncbi:MAG TPA: hypothetical protein VMM27_06695 [Casimicrobiaceae bacterium]|nr:hypothetical protein [Casimicrobiaceae bacterium]
MTPLVGLSVVLGLVVAFFLARRAARTMRERRHRQRRQLKRSVHRRPEKSSPRSEMRANEDPSTVAGDITTRDGAKKQDS